MPTQEELNAAQVELDIANDNYAQMANKYNQFQDVFKLYANATPEMQAKAKDAMVRALDEFENLKLNMYAAEDRIQQAQNRVNSYNEIIANQPVQQTVVRSGYNSGRNMSPTNNLGGWQDEPEVINDTINGSNGFIVREGWQPIYNSKGEIVGEQRIIPEGERNLEAAKAKFPSNTIVTEPTNTYQPSQAMLNNMFGKDGSITASETRMPSGRELGARGLGSQLLSDATFGLYQSNSPYAGTRQFKKGTQAALPVELGATMFTAGLAAPGVGVGPKRPVYVQPRYTGVTNARYTTPKWADATNYGRSALQRSNVFTPLK